MNLQADSLQMLERNGYLTMMNFHILTLFPEMVMQGLHTSILGRAVEREYISIEAVNIRDYTLDKHGKVDDYTEVI